MKSWFQKRGYPEDVINTEMKKVIFNGNSGKSSNKSKGVQFMLTYHPLLKKGNNIIRKHIHLLYMNEEVKKVFWPGPMASFQSPRNLSSYIDRAKMYPMERKTGSCKWVRVRGVRNVLICLKRKHLPAQWPIRHTKLTIALTVTTNAWHIFWQARLILSSMLVVPQVVSDIVGTIINVMTENMREVRLVCKNIFLNIFWHNGFLHDVSDTLIDKTDKRNPVKREHYWQHTLKTSAPHGHNVEDDFWNTIYLYLYSAGTMYWSITYYYCYFGYCYCNIIIVAVAVTVVIVPYGE